jgi:hypothetical protein
MLIIIKRAPGPVRVAVWTDDNGQTVVEITIARAPAHFATFI